MSSPSPDDAIFDVPAEGEGSLEVWLRLAPGALPFRSADGRFYARVPVGDRHEVHGLKSTALRDWLIDGYWLIMASFLATGPFAEFSTPSKPARGSMAARRRSSFASAPDNAVDDYSSSYLDLGDPSGWAIKIGAEGWSVVNRPDVHFRRLQGLLALPLPSREARSNCSVPMSTSTNPTSGC